VVYIFQFINYILKPMKYELNLLVKLRIAMQTINLDWFVELREQWSIYLSKIGVI
jgi:hypothetical protein